ncbi:MAG: DUF3899 domain-containing protein [Lactobacillales bacterium]|jgi:uncharacterized membrane protein|nr:DUF3899 domain-containing protein [Lactobacillales bacterium]
MTRAKKILLTILILLIVMFSIFFLKKKSLTPQLISDTSFLISLPFLVIGGFMRVVKSGSFDTFHQSMQAFWKRNAKTDENFETHQLSSMIETGYYYWLGTGAFFLVLALLCLVFI